MLIYKSEVLSQQGGTSYPKSVPLAFLPTEGPGKGRLVIEQIIIQSDIQVDTPVGVTANGAHLFGKVLKLVRLWDAESDRVKFTGPSLRLWDWLNNGRRAKVDPAAIVANTLDQVRTMYHRIDFCPRRTRRRFDYAIPVDILQAGGGLELTFPAASDLAFTGGNPTSIDSLTYQAYFVCREEDPNHPEVHTRCEWKEIEATSRTEFRLPLNGAKLRALALFKAADAASGGTSITSITDVTASGLGYEATARGIIKQREIIEGDHDEASTADPFVADTAMVIVSPERDQKIPSMFRHPGELHFRIAGNTVDQLVMVHELVTGRTKRSQAGDVKRTAGRNVVGERVKTAKGTKRDPAAWRGDETAFMPGHLFTAQAK